MAEHCAVASCKAYTAARESFGAGNPLQGTEQVPHMSWIEADAVVFHEESHSAPPANCSSMSTRERFRLFWRDLPGDQGFDGSGEFAKIVEVIFQDGLENLAVDALIVMYRDVSKTHHRLQTLREFRRDRALIR